MAPSGPEAHDRRVTGPATEVRIEPPLWARAWIVVFVLVWVWIWTTRIESPGAVGWLAGVAVLALSARMWVMGAVGTADGRLTVRNQFSTRTFRREEIADVTIDRAHGPVGFGWTVWLTLQDGSRHQIQLTQTPFRTGFLGHLERDAGRLRAWMRATGAPYEAGDTR
jgi:hypothetical protein